MPLADATPDKRIYELLKTVDLENLTFADLQAVGQTIYAEQGAEDELRRLVLLNLARLSVLGEWTGLTSAGASGFTGMISQLPGAPSNVDTFTLSRTPVYGAARDFSSSTGVANYNYPAAFPFIAPKTGNITEMSINVSTIDTGGTTISLAIYDTNAGNLPNNLLGYGDFTMLSTGDEVQTTFSATISLTEGELYYYAIVTDQAPTGGAITAQGINGYPATLGMGTGPSDTDNICWRHTGGGAGIHTLPNPFTIDLAGGTTQPRPDFGLVIT